MNRRGFFASITAAAVAYLVPVVTKARAWYTIIRHGNGYEIDIHGGSDSDVWQGQRGRDEPVG